MKAIILVAGYATRLYPLTLDKPKALLEINHKPIIDYIVDEINTIDAVDEIYVVTNHKFIQHFTQWQQNTISAKPIFVLDDGTVGEEDRRGAIGDILFTIEQKTIEDDCMVIAGDNFFTYPLLDYYAYYQQKKADCVCVKQIEDKEMAKQVGIALVDESGKVLEIEEKPLNPKSDLAVYATYMYTKETMQLFKQYIEEGNKPDAPGHFPEWLCTKKAVYAYVFEGECYDIGTPESYKQVCDLYHC